MDGVWRTARKPRWLVLLVLVLVLSSGMAWLGNWQLARAREHGDAARQAKVAATPVQYFRNWRRVSPPSAPS